MMKMTGMMASSSNLSALSWEASFVKTANSASAGNSSSVRLREKGV